MQKYTCYKNSINILKLSCTESHKRLRIRFILYLEMTGREFLIEICDFKTLLTLLKKVEKCLCIQFFYLSF